MSYVKIDTSEHTIETERLILRLWKETDLMDFYLYASQPGVGELAGWHHHKNIDESKEILEMFITNKNDFAIVLKETNKVIGSFGFHDSWVNKDDESEYKNLKNLSIGYVLAKTYWGRGLMPEALNAVIKYLFDNDIVEAIAISHFQHNIQSKRVIEKAGFKFVRDGTHMTRMGIEHKDKKYILLKNSFEELLNASLENQ
ncbi:MAG: GNAT family N-acetyltransferase [Defluviitaleaceae bacterium]|nr:GNAT family N-acetyltransferase [Defluviitaleaceae bacterium]